MRISEILRLVFINIYQSKVKVFLTSLGIIVGAATIVMVIAIGDGGKQDVAEQFKTLNAGTITVTASSGGNMGMGGMGGMPSGMSPNQMMSSRSSGGGKSSGGMSGKSNFSLPSNTSFALTKENLDDILFFVPDISAGAINISTSSDASSEYLEEAIEIDIVGTQSSYAKISNLSIAIGDFITETENENKTRALTLGYNVAVELFGSAFYAYDQKVEIDGRSYVVNGVLEQVGSVVSGINADETVFMPYSTAEKYLLGKNISPQISILATDVESVEGVINNVELVLKQSNPDGFYTITDSGATMDAAMDSANTLSTLLLAVALIVFIVGGIGIMNVLFVSVKERTKEIGVLKAIGTRKKDILLMFLIEAAMIGFVGGFLGILLSLGIAPIVEKQMTILVTPYGMLLGFTFAGLTGSLFGFYPAWKASMLVPVVALNQ